MRLFGGLVDPSLLAPAPNLLRMVFHPLGMRPSIVNWDEVARYALTRAEHDLTSVPGDRAAIDLLAEVRGYAGPQHRPAPSIRPADILLPIHLRAAGGELRLFSTIMTLGTPQDVTLQELRVETFFPADAASQARFDAWPAG